MKNPRSSFFLITFAVLLFIYTASVFHVSAEQEYAQFKSRLIATIDRMQSAANEFVSNAQRYAEILAQHQDKNEFDSETAKKIRLLLDAMQQNYKDMDSFGYETIEAVVAGVPSLAHHDVILDAGLPEGQGAADEVARYTLSLPNGKKLVNPGALFTYVIEPTLWESRPNFLIERTIEGRRLPCPDVLVAAAVEVSQRIAELFRDAVNWKPTTHDLMGALLQMTPTLGDYFDEWKESRYSSEKSGLFTAVSRISDMRGIMGNCREIFLAVSPVLAQKNVALRDAVDRHFREILEFLDEIEQGEKENRISFEEAEELVSISRRRTDALLPLLEQMELALTSD